MQKVAETQETLSRLSLTPRPVLAGRGTGWICHEVPFHCSASPALLPALSRYEPTASQKLLDTHEAAASVLLVAPGGATAC